MGLRELITRYRVRATTDAKGRTVLHMERRQLTDAVGDAYTSLAHLIAANDKRLRKFLADRYDEFMQTGGK